MGDGRTVRLAGAHRPETRSNCTDTKTQGSRSRTTPGAVPAGERYDYDPYGELENASSLEDEAEENPFRFEGFYDDSAVKSYGMLARPYRPDIARFLTVDRLASASQDLLLQSDPLTQNRYAFAGANPVNNVEFDGHFRPSNAGGSSGKDKMPDECPPSSCQKTLDTAAYDAKPGRVAFGGDTSTTKPRPSGRLGAYRGRPKWGKPVTFNDIKNAAADVGWSMVDDLVAVAKDPPLTPVRDQA